MANIEIDGQIYVVEAGGNLLETCLQLGLDLPYFCWHHALGSVGACRQCAVVQYLNPEDQRGKVVMACMTQVTDGLRAAVQSQKAREFRAGIIELLMSNHPHDCPVCEEGGECHLQDMTEMTGHTFRRHRGKKRTHRNQKLGPFINHEMNRCIACYRCVRYYQDYSGGRDLQVFAAHHHVYFGRQEDGALESEFSGNLVEVCPTGVFTDKTFSQHYTRKWDLQTAPSICAHCALGCNTSPGERYGTLRRVVNRYHGEVNGYFLCDRGRFGYGFVNSALRVGMASSCPPISSTGSRGQTIEPSAHPTELSERFVELVQASAGLIGIGSPRASLEANFALRQLVGEENFHLGVSATEQVLLESVADFLRHGPVHIVSLREVEEADAVFVLGEDVSNTAPRLALSLRQAVRNEVFALAEQLKIPRWQDAAVRCVAQERKSPLFIASFAATRLDDAAEGVYRGKPEDLARLGLRVAEHINPVGRPSGRSNEPGQTNPVGWPSGHRFGGLKPALQSAPENALRSPINEEAETLATRIASALQSAQRPLIVSGTGCLSLALIQAAARIAEALAAKRGLATDVHFVVPECNSLGLAMLGGHSLSSAFEAVEQGKAETVIVLENDLYRRAERSRVNHCLERAKQVVVIDHLLHETAQHADLLLPAATFAESEGTWVSSEGRAQRYFAVFPPKDGIQDSWCWLALAARKHWAGIDPLTQACAQALPQFQAITQAAPNASLRIQGQKIPRQPHRYSGRTAMLANVRIHEPKQPVDTQSALTFSMEGTPTNRPAALNPFAWAPGWNSNQSVNKLQEKIGGHLKGGDPGVRLLEPQAQPGFANRATAGDFTPLSPAGRGAGGEGEGAFLLVPIYHVFGSEELSLLSEPLAQRAPAPYLALNPEDAETLGLAAGDEVKITLSGEPQHLPILPLPGLTRGLAGLPVGLPGIAWVEFGEAVWEYGGKA